MILYGKDSGGTYFRLALKDSISFGEEEIVLNEDELMQLTIFDSKEEYDKDKDMWHTKTIKFEDLENDT